MRLLLTLLLLICSWHGFTQTNKSAQEIYNLVSSKMEEKLYLHIDKETCQQGDTIWFRGYLVNAIHNTPVDYSRYIYVEIFDRQDSVYIREKIERSGEDSLFIGCIEIPENLQQGEYFLRSYTYYMQNFDESFYDTKRIRVINPFDHRVTINAQTIQKRNGERELQLTFTNNKGTLYENLEFLYRIPGETPWGEFKKANTGFSGKSNITIKDSLSDYILIRASTNSIVDIERYIAIPQSKRDFQIDFMPEGGKLIANVNQRIGIKCIGRDGLGIPVSGTIIDETGTKLTEFYTNELGMGSFEILCNTERKYFAVAQSNEGKIKRFQLPSPTTGNAIRLDTEGGKVKYSVLHSDGMTIRGKQLLILSRGVLLLQIDLSKSHEANLLLQDCPEGILNFRLVDKDMNTLSERLLYNHKEKRENLNLITPYELTGEHESETITLVLQNQGDIVSGQFSVSITNNRLNQSNLDNCGIDSYMLLYSDLNGHIENPNFYFPCNAPIRIADLDNLMLTQGWRQFELPAPTEYYMERGQFIAGRVDNLFGKKHGNAKIRLEGSNGFFREADCDANGEFLIEDIFFREGTYFTAQAFGKNGKENQKLTVYDQQFKKLKGHIPEATFIRNSDNKFYKEFSKEYIYTPDGTRINTLGEVSVRKTPNQIRYDFMVDSIEKRNRKLFHLGITDIKYYGSLGSFETAWGGGIGGESKSQFNGYQMYIPGSLMDTYAYYQRIVQGYSAESHKEKNMKATRAHYRFIGYDYEEPKLLGVKFNVMSSLVLRGTGIYDNYIPHIEVHFNVQNFAPLAPQLSEYTTFYQPHYNVDNDVMNIVDEKITRYWNPSVKISSDSHFNITFPRAKLDDTYTITVNGITESGTPIHLQQSFE